MEITQYLLNHVLKVTDWASMSHSLEVRVPFIDRDLFRNLAINNFEPTKSYGKPVAFEQVAPKLPPSIFKRKKTGFGIPVIDFMSKKINLNKEYPNSHNPGMSSRVLALTILREFIDEDILRNN